MEILTKAAQVLDVINDFLGDAPDQEVANLWDVLSAIRGPDVSNSENDKQVTTAIIRAAAFPRARNIAVGATFNRVGTENIKIVPDPYSNHFNRHIKYAQIALNRMDRNPFKNQK